MIALSAFIESVGLVGPGLNNWADAQALLAGRAPYVAARTVVPAPASLPAAERRRTGTSVKLALAVGHEAVAGSGRDAASLATVFAASGGDGQNCHVICETLAGEDRALSPTRFHNSVHNAPAGYWSIATRAMAPSNVLSAYDGSFAAGLLESLCQVAVDGVPTLLIAFDTDYPAPMHDVRPIPDAFGVALVLTPTQSTNTLARIDARLTDTPATVLAMPEFEQMRLGNPAARALPLLDTLAAQRTARVVLDYLQDVQLQLDVTMSNGSGEPTPLRPAFLSRRRSTMRGSLRTSRIAARCACSTRWLNGMPSTSAVRRPVIVTRTIRCVRMDVSRQCAASNTPRKRWQCTVHCWARRRTVHARAFSPACETSKRKPAGSTR
jgi:hypothetical protein